MSYGSPVPSTVVPFRMLPVMPVQERTQAGDAYSSFTPSSPTHPHPLRSHSAASKHSKHSQHRSSIHQSYKGNSRNVRSARDSMHRSGDDGSYFDLNKDEAKMPPLPTPTHLSFRNSIGSTKRFGDSPMSLVNAEYPIVASVRPCLRQTMSYGDATRPTTRDSPRPVRPILRPTLSYGDASWSGARRYPAVGVAPDYPIVATRPPLRPTVSFGGESRMSYYSLASITLESKSQLVAAEEQLLQRQQRIDVREGSSGKVFAYFGIPCMQRRRRNTSPSIQTGQQQHRSVGHSQVSSLPPMAELPG